MLDTSSYQVPSRIVKPINGRGHQAFKHLTKSQRAAIAVALTRGEATLQPTLEVVSAALGVSRTYVETAAKLTSEQLREVRLGKVTLSDLKPATATPTPVKAEMTPDEGVAAWHTWTAEQRAAFGQRVGIAKLWDDAIIPTIEHEVAL